MKWKVSITRISTSTISVEVEAEEALLAERAAVDLAKTMDFPLERKSTSRGSPSPWKRSDITDSASLTVCGAPDMWGVRLSR